MKGQVRTLKESVQVRVTDQLDRTEGQVRLLDEGRRSRGTHVLLSAEEGMNQDTKKARRQQALTSCLAEEVVSEPRRKASE